MEKIQIRDTWLAFGYATLHKSVEIKVLTIFAQWWKDSDPYLWLTDPDGQKNLRIRNTARYCTLVYCVVYRQPIKPVRQLVLLYTGESRSRENIPNNEVLNWVEYPYRTSSVRKPASWWAASSRPIVATSAIISSSSSRSMLLSSRPIPFDKEIYNIS